VSPCFLHAWRSSSRRSWALVIVQVSRPSRARLETERSAGDACEPLDLDAPCPSRRSALHRFLDFSRLRGVGALWPSWVGPEVAPEIDGGTAAPALALMAGGLVVLHGRRCPICAGSWSRCRLCSVRQPVGEAIACPVAHGNDLSPLYCRCGAIMGLGFVQMPAGEQIPMICDVAMRPDGLLGWFVPAAQRTANTRAAALSHPVEMAPSSQHIDQPKGPTTRVGSGF